MKYKKQHWKMRQCKNFLIVSIRGSGFSFSKFIMLWRHSPKEAWKSMIPQRWTFLSTYTLLYTRYTHRRKMVRAYQKCLWIASNITWNKMGASWPKTMTLSPFSPSLSSKICTNTRALNTYSKINGFSHWKQNCISGCARAKNPHSSNC